MVYWAQLPTITVFQCANTWSPSVPPLRLHPFSASLGRDCSLASQALLVSLRWLGYMGNIPSICVCFVLSRILHRELNFWDQIPNAQWSIRFLPRFYWCKRQHS